MLMFADVKGDFDNLLNVWLKDLSYGGSYAVHISLMMLSFDKGRDEHLYPNVH